MNNIELYSDLLAQILCNCLNVCNDKNSNNEKWITIKGNHILLKDGETPKQAAKKFEIKAAIQKIKSGAETEITITDVRDDLVEYGGTNNITFLKGNQKGGIEHIEAEHAEDFEGVINTIVKGKITTVVPSRKVYIETKDYLALLSLDYFGKKKTWLLTGYKKDEDNKK